MEEDGDHLDGTSEGNEAEVDTEANDSKLFIEAAVVAKNVDNGEREEFENEREKDSDGDRNAENDAEGFADAIVIFSADVVAENRLSASDEADNDINNNGEDFTGDAESGDGNIAAIS